MDRALALSMREREGEKEAHDNQLNMATAAHELRLPLVRHTPTLAFCSTAQDKQFVVHLHWLYEKVS